MTKKFIIKDFVIITLITSLWVHAYQLVRFFAYVRGALQNYLSMVPNVAPMDEVGVLLIWGAWDMLLTALYVFLFWLCAQVFGNNRKSILISGLTSWCLLYILFWGGLANMNLIGWDTVAVVLPMTLLETMVASLIASKLYKRKKYGCIE